MNFTHKFADAMAQLALAAQGTKRHARRLARAAFGGRQPRNKARECARRRRQIERDTLKPQSRGI
ncbi:MAG: hypothetical protein LC121_16080 [Anaerolineae bacterium]|nr:hypothetical protein [Anaerolineae bacterium]